MCYELNEFVINFYVLGSSQEWILYSSFDNDFPSSHSKYLLLTISFFTTQSPPFTELISQCYTLLQVGSSLRSGTEDRHVPKGKKQAPIPFHPFLAMKSLTNCLFRTSFIILIHKSVVYYIFPISLSACTQSLNSQCSGQYLEDSQCPQGKSRCSMKRF